MDVLPIDRPRIIGQETEYSFSPHPKINPAQFGAALPGDIKANSIGSDIYDSSGKRIYIDQLKNFEVATPECLSIDDLLAAHFSGERVISSVASKMFAPEFRLRKRTIDTELNTSGDHENYLTGNGFGYENHAKKLLAHLASRIVLTGPGMLIGTNKNIRYALDQKVWSMGGLTGSSGTTTTGRKPFIATRNEPFDDDHETNRLQVVCGSMNMFAFPIASRFLTTSTILRLIEHDKYPNEVEFSNPFEAMRSIASDPELKAKVRLENGKRYTGIEIQLILSEAAEKIVPDIPYQERSMHDLTATILQDMKDGNIERWDGYIEWFAKLELLTKFATKHGLGSNDSRLQELDIKWHDINQKGIVNRLRAKGNIAMMPNEAEIAAARITPPQNTRARLRGEAVELSNFTDVPLKYVNWHCWEFEGDPGPTVINNAYQYC